MNDDQIKREADDAKLIDDAFQHLIDTYMASRHRKKVDVITKAWDVTRRLPYYLRSRSCFTTISASTSPR